MPEHLGHSNYTSDRVFTNELDPVIPACPLRGTDELLSIYCGQEGFVTAWQQSLERCLACEEVSDTEISDLQGRLPQDLGTRDVSLVVAALKLGNERQAPSIIITDDCSLYNEVERLRLIRHVDLQNVRYLTSFVTSYFSIQLLRELHLSCGIDSIFWKNAMFSFKDHHNGRAEAAAREHNSNVLEFFATYFEDCVEKQMRATTAKLATEFGDDNE